MAQSIWWLYNIYELSYRLNSDKVDRRLAMVLSEGAVFLTILFVGFFITYRSFKKEIQFSNQQRNFLLSITHELKTPIAAVKLFLQTMYKRDLDREKQQEMLQKSLAETERLNTLVENILTVTKLEEEAYFLNKEKFNLSDLIQSVGLKMMESNKKSVHFDFVLQPDVFFNGDKSAFQIILINLIGNAIKYTKENTSIIVSLFQKDGETAFSVSDEGPGVPKEDKDKIFNKFYRVGNENTRNAKGTGLGLFIVKQLTNQHKGRVFIKRNQPKGSIFVCTFPKEANQ